MTFGIAWLSFTGIGYLIYAVNQLSGKYRLGSIVASFFVLLDPVVRWIVLQAYWMYYVSPVSWSSIEHWKILGMERPLNQNIIIPANVIICIVLFYDKYNHIDCFLREILNFSFLTLEFSLYC